jgi:hypothetical protein
MMILLSNMDFRDLRTKLLAKAILIMCLSLIILRLKPEGIQLEGIYFTVENHLLKYLVISKIFN